MSSTRSHCVIVGAGHSAAQLCVSLTKEKWPGKITLIGDEPLLPYHRPPLSKTQLSVDSPEPLLFIRPDDFYTSHNIDLISGQRVDSIDRESKELLIGSQRIQYDSLVLATGSIPRRPPIAGIDHPKVFQLYTAKHANQIRNQIRGTIRVVVIGAGFIGLEVASSLRRLGLKSRFWNCLTESYLELRRPKFLPGSKSCTAVMASICRPASWLLQSKKGQTV